MATRGNEGATADVRPHAWVGAGLLAVGAFLTLPAPSISAFALLCGATLVLECVLLWYLPSFAKRSLLGPEWSARAGAAIFPVALALNMISPLAASALAAIGLLHVALLLFASVAWGAPWRSGIPFWRAGPWRAGDMGAALTLAIALGQLTAAAVALASTRAWTLALAIATLGTLAHFLPRARGCASAPAMVVGGAALAAVASWLPVAPGWVVPVGLLVSCAGIVGGPPGKPAGARLRDAAPALLAGVASLGLLLLALPQSLGAATGLGLFGLCLVTLPVVFNATPIPSLVWGAALAGILVPASAYLTFPAQPVAAGIAVLLALAALSPLRRPRRDCPAEPS